MPCQQGPLSNEVESHGFLNGPCGRRGKESSSQRGNKGSCTSPIDRPARQSETEDGSSISVSWQKHYWGLSSNFASRSCTSLSSVQGRQDPTERPENHSNQKNVDFVHLRALASQPNPKPVDYMPLRGSAVQPLWGSSLQQTQSQLRGSALPQIQSNSRRRRASAGMPFVSISHCRLSWTKLFRGSELWD